MSPSPTPPASHRGEHGFTLVEMLVAMVSGMVVIIATLSILDISISQSARISERVDANQRGRLAMEKIMLELHSSCTEFGANAVEPGSNATKIIFTSQTGAEAYFTHLVKHEIKLAEGKLTDTSYISNNEPGGKWTYPETPTGTQTLLTGVSQSNSGVTAVFQYYKYVGGNLSGTALTTPLSKEDAENTAEIVVSFTAAPSFTAHLASEGTKGDRAIDFTNTAVLRFDPASATGSNEPCA
jgi:Tfp pilus assembly protein PilW